ncbi:hybrid sensor histidine kinase/response regulator [Pantanalinema sp. GBBB05]|uniref:hybrid sensor histidine kinase/response regulator n=1 Tax=Pantanalinema sp. GBBB05 TaxID=2604139 RepID=UPI001D3737A4|nr:hybrid sensor histidine kinase/response regulator [Pantanalinema sp. GBBB05]
MTSDVSKPIYILLVDDNPNNLKVLSEAIQGHGWKALMATDGESAIEQAEYMAPDLILLDVMMPGFDGFETCRRLKANSITQNIPIIFMTALSDTQDKVKGFDIGAVDYITKPFQQEEVVARLKLHLKITHLTQTLEQRVEERTAELARSLNLLQNTQLQLIQNEKMSALGNLVAGVAHEINNPVGFLSGNLQPAEEYVRDLIELVDLYQQTYTNPTPEIQDQIEAIDLDYVREDLPKLLNSMKLGIDRIRNISISLRTFSRADKDYKVPFDIHEGLDSTLLILKHRLKANDHRPEIDVVKKYGDLPSIECFPGQLNQVFMNILANAIDALEEANLSRDLDAIKAKPNQISIETIVIEGRTIQIHITDNGVGISEAVKSRIFDHLFTTKAVGKGTGLGLAIAHQIVVENHAGTIEVNSDPQQGTEFIITLPIKAKDL